MAEIITYGIKSVTHGAVSIPNAKNAAWNEDFEMVEGGGDDKLLPVLNRPVYMTDSKIRVECEDAIWNIVIGTKATLVWIEKTLAGTRTHTAVNMVYCGRGGSAQDRGGRANRTNHIFDHESADGVTAFHTVSDGAAAATTLSADVDDSVTTIPVNSAGGFAATGTVQIGSEKITYTGHTDGALTGCTRGTGGTSPASHSAGAAITQV